MNEHLTDADLVALALLPDEQPDIRLHLASCQECERRFSAARDELDRQRDEHHDATDSHDPTFWKRQELAVMREVARQSRPAAARRSLAAVALLTVAFGGFWFGRTSIDTDLELTPGPVPIATTIPSPTRTDQAISVPASEASTDPWESESLEEFQAVVDWESWVDEERKDQGTI